MPTRRTTRIGLLVALPLLLGACGVSTRDGGAAASAPLGGSGSAAPATTSTAPAPDGGTTGPTSTTVERGLNPTQRQMAATMTKTYTDLGLDPDDARCLGEAIARDYGDVDQAKVLDLISSCGISTSDLARIAGEMGATTPADGAKAGLTASLESQGLSEEDATCVADAFVAEHGVDITAAQDPAVVKDLLEGCDVDPSDLRPGG
ncbi:hypothetical protein KSP35_04920 [Aquihabitans sp. G128]|uniref:hypothetical protein n=1 Tax=Aquihabitans sp. G128 TaxID=2849779 RepID=UPI001C250932|nr:hypothetical protein [Aquihabitans sp. G128]QXC62155.1 hypothetical protein KSP35_04920 [Aquihabitans sp. G128]